MKKIICFILILGIATGLLNAQMLSPSSNQWFPQGVASGDPLKNSVVLWTRVSPDADQKAVELEWEISTVPQFGKVIQKGKVKALAKDNYCVKVIPENLKSGTTYYYRFLKGEEVSPLGRTKTLPKEVEKIRLAFVNCSKYEGGYFNGFNALTKPEFADISAVIHLGDYIYENPAIYPKSYAPSVKATGRKHKPEHEIVSLEDYRIRFQQYREDPDLQATSPKFSHDQYLG